VPLDLRSIDLNLLTALDALLAERNVTRAAARLRLSQSAMSAALGRLRSLFGDPLLLRTAGGMLPTSKGAELAAPVKQVLADIGRLVRPAGAFNPAAARVTFTIAASDYVEYAILPRLVDYLEAHAPLARLAVRAMDFGAVGRQLETGEVDLGILGAGFAPPNARSRPLYLERFVCVVRRDHPRLKERLSLDEFCALEHLLVAPSGGGFTAQTDDALAAIGRRRQVRLSVPHFLLVPEILVRSDMIAVLPERLARGYRDRFRIFEPPLEMPPFAIVEVWHERTHRDLALVWLRQALADLTREEAAPVAPLRPSPARAPEGEASRARRYSAPSTARNVRSSPRTTRASRS
jgi:DNA-binding transcriptional LysR family regulator